MAGDKAFTQPVTEFNAAAAPLVPTQINAGAVLPRGGELMPGERIGPYTVTRPLTTSSGEAALYLCELDGVTRVAKLYRRSGALKPEITGVLRQLDSPYVARLIDTLEKDGHPVEILPYYKNGSLAGRRFTMQELESIVIPGAIEGLRALHEANVLHRDLKPSNIMLTDDMAGVALIDFGIASYRADGSTVVVTSVGMTPEYSAPETFAGLYLEESDYYSLGITLFELFTGSGPYHGMSAGEIEKYLAVRRLPYPDDMPPRLRELIGALTFADITNRRDRHNPNRRWKYDEVKRFLAGEDVVLPGAGGVSGAALGRPFVLCGETYTQLPELTRALARHWDEGRRMLLDGTLGRFFRLTRPDMEEICLHAERDAARHGGHDDIVYWKALYRLNPRLGSFYWRGAEFSSISAFGRDALERLWAGDHSRDKLYASILGERVISEHLRLSEQSEKYLADTVATIEDGYAEDVKSGRGPGRAYFLMAYLTSGQHVLALAGQKFRSVEELTGYMQALLSRGYKYLEKFCHGLVDYDGNLDVQLESWLIALGRGAQLELWREQMRSD